MALPASRRPLRRAALPALILAVLAAHLWLAETVWAPWAGRIDAERAPGRLSVAFVRELQPAAPPPPARRPVAPRAVAAAAVAVPPPAEAASAPAAAASGAPEAASAAAPAAVTAAADTPPAAPAPAASATAEPVAAAPPAAGDGPAAAAGMAASAAAPPAFDWPPSTRLSYRLDGDYRGPVQGQARVEWLRSGTRYQVHLELEIGPHFAPLITRRISSDGEITAAGLSPRRYDEETRVALMAPRRLSILLEPETVRLPGGAVLPRPAGVQDSASQFVQLTWMFIGQPELLQAGRQVVLSLALPRQVDRWTYDVVGPETLDTPLGPVDAVHLRPQRAARPGGDLVAEVWVAPSLQYLPVRILVRHGAGHWIDMRIERLPQQAEPGR